jgi:hypothetical protein
MKNKRNLLIAVIIIFFIIVFILKDNFFSNDYESIIENSVTSNIQEETKSYDEETIKVHIYR